MHIKKEDGDWDNPIRNKKGSNKTWNKPCATATEKERATIYYFWLVGSIHLRLGKIVKKPSNWLPYWKLFELAYFLCTAELCSANPRGKFIVAY